MYAGNGSDGRPLDAATARRRAANEPLAEIAQTKGQSETHPLLSPEDEFAGFELFERLFNGKQGRVHGSYLREAWGLGLVLSQRFGVNPYRSGVVGATDLHNGLSDTRENTYRGSDGREPDPKTGRGPALACASGAGEGGPTGAAELAGVWRDPHFDPAEPALYSVRVLEMPTPRGSTLLAEERGLDLAPGAPAEIQERAWSSPIWYTPAPAS